MNPDFQKFYAAKRRWDEHCRIVRALMRSTAKAGMQGAAMYIAGCVLLSGLSLFYADTILAWLAAFLFAVTAAISVYTLKINWRMYQANREDLWNWNNDRNAGRD